MCYSVKFESATEQIEARFIAKINEKGMALLERGLDLNGFTHPYLPVIINDLPNEIQAFEWGLLPDWAPDYGTLKVNTLNAKRETLNTTMYRHYITRRCLVIVDGFYEPHWLDPLGKQKEKYYLHMVDEQPFALAGLWTVNYMNGERPTFTIITKPAVGLAAEVHNSKLRMPFILDPMFEREWLMGGEVPDTIPDLAAYSVGSYKAK